MKYYGFKFPSLKPDRSKINIHVGTWIGLLGTFLFFIGAAESGGLKGSINANVWFTIFYPVLIWFINSLAEEHKWAKSILIILSAIATLLSFFTVIWILIYKQNISSSLLCFLILNIGVFILARKKVISIYK